jgi:Uncharacterised nucleotidyltransferase
MSLTTHRSPKPAAPTSRKLFGMTVSPEWEMLLAIASPVAQPTTLRGLIDQPFDWALFEHLAEVHGLLPMAAAKLGSDSSLLPGAVVDELRRICQENARRGLWFAGELFSVLDTLTAAGIPAVPYKGPTLAAMAQGDLILRQFCDLDILISPLDWPRAKQALIAVGFTAGLNLTPREERAYVKSACDFTFHHDPVKNVLEIHWDIVPRFFGIRIPMRQMLARAIKVDLCGRSVPTLAPEDLLLCLTLHGTKHAWSRLCWLSDVAHLIHRAEIDPEKVRRRAERWRIGRIVRVGLFLAQWLLGTELPESLQNWIREDSETAKAAGDLARNMFRDNKLRTESLEYFRLFARQREHPVDRARMFALLATTSSLSEWRSVRLPAPLFPLYGAVRFWRLSRRFLRDGL